MENIMGIITTLQTKYLKADFALMLKKRLHLLEHWGCFHSLPPNLQPSVLVYEPAITVYIPEYKITKDSWYKWNFIKRTYKEALKEMQRDISTSPEFLIREFYDIGCILRFINMHTRKSTSYYISDLRAFYTNVLLYQNPFIIYNGEIIYDIQFNTYLPNYIDKDLIEVCKNNTITINGVMEQYPFDDERLDTALSFVAITDIPLQNEFTKYFYEKYNIIPILRKNNKETYILPCSCV